MANTTIATPEAHQLQLWTYNFYNFFHTNCNSTTLQLQLDKSTSIATLQLQPLIIDLTTTLGPWRQKPIASPVVT
jgi:hypothetical protein